MIIKFLLICLVTAPFHRAPLDNISVARINNVIVQKAELAREMTRYRAIVYAGGSGNEQALKKRAFKAIILIKVQEAELKRNKLWPYADYRALLISLAKTNLARQKEAAEGKPVYGPVHYDEITYFDYCFSNAVTKLQGLRHISEQAYTLLVLKRVANAQITMLQEL